MHANIRRAGILIAFIAVALILLSLLRTTPVAVEIALVSRRPLTVTVEEQGHTRARDPFIVAAPVSGRLLRSDLDAGDVVTRSQVIARIALAPQDSRTEAVQRANLVAAEAREAAAQAALIEAQSAYARAMNEQQRRDELFKNNLSSTEEVQTYRQSTDSAQARMLSMQAALQAAKAEVASARSLLMGVKGEQDTAITEVIAPVDGTVYRIYENSERVVPAGTPLVEISNDDSLEIVIDLLTQEAVQVKNMAPVLISGWGGQDLLQARVRRVEPEAFTKVSALGVEEQRVNVIADLSKKVAGLGAGYRVNAAIVIWEEDNVLTVPVSAIFQRNNTWFVYLVKDSHTVLQQVQTGVRNREFAQVIAGLAEGDSVVIYPSDLVTDGIKVSPN